MNKTNSIPEELTDEEKIAVEKQFDALCKKSMANAVKNYIKSQRAKAAREISYDELTENLEPFTYDEYFKAFPLTVQGGKTVELFDRTLYDAVNMLCATARNIILSYYCLDMNDREISDTLGIPRSSVTYQRAASLAKLKEILKKQ